MEQHAVPHQVTTFEFKLIGFLTIKQFVYLLVFAGLAVLFYFLLLPIAPANYVVAGLTMIMGAVFALFKYNERELDVWIKNLLTSLLSPSQYYYIKHNIAPDFLKGVYVSGDDTITATHIDAQQKLAKYIDSKKPTGVEPNQKTQKIQTLLEQPQQPQQVVVAATTPVSATPTITTTPPPAPTQKPAAALSGVIHNNRNEPLPNIMVYINSDAGQVVRILKTNHHGLFATFHPLPPGSYSISPKDLGGRYFFDTMNIVVDDQQPSPIQIYSKEVL
ncbi:MAG: PrgI family protein [Microgenomates bacterium OLB23]|nr:MAG: PrgI family protein [Microgenomates bacterium OLB23]